LHTLEVATLDAGEAERSVSEVSDDCDGDGVLSSPEGCATWGKGVGDEQRTSKEAARRGDGDRFRKWPPVVERGDPLVGGTSKSYTSSEERPSGVNVLICGDEPR
jgi:hypothetical protein